MHLDSARFALQEIRDGSFQAARCETPELFQAILSERNQLQHRLEDARTRIEQLQTNGDLLRRLDRYERSDRPVCRRALATNASSSS